MTAVLGIHLIALGVWIGVVGAEFVIEFAGMKDDEALKRAALLHYKTDVWVEIPAFLTVLVTGLLMVNTSHLGGLFLAKIGFALAAIALNMLNVYAVFRRRKFALLDDMEGVHSTARLIQVSSLIIPCFLIAFGIGMWFLIVAGL